MSSPEQGPPEGPGEPVRAASCRLQMRVDTLDWPAMLLGAIGADFAVIEPPELTDHLRRVGERFVCSADPDETPEDTASPACRLALEHPFE